jgi:hypothetical protein
VVDIRLNNSSQLAGFAKREDLAYFLRETCGAGYVHEPLLAPTQELLDRVKGRQCTWAEFEREFLDLMAAEQCHRRLMLDYLQRVWGGPFKVIHL